MASFIDWDDVDTTKRGKGRSGGGGGGKFMRLEANQTHRIRPIHKPVMFYKFYHTANGQFRTAIIESPEKSSLKEKHPQLRPSRRFAMVVFDRDDDNKMKILEFGSTVYEKFKSYKQITKEEPGGANGGDFNITVECPNGKKDRDTTYDVQFAERCDFSDEERELIQAEQAARKEDKGDYDLKKIFRPMSDEEVEEKLFGESGGSGGDSEENEQKPKPREQAEQPKKVEASAKSSSDDDPFNWDDE